MEINEQFDAYRQWYAFYLKEVLWRHEKHRISLVCFSLQLDRGVILTQLHRASPFLDDVKDTTLLAILETILVGSTIKHNELSQTHNQLSVIFHHCWGHHFWLAYNMASEPPSPSPRPQKQRLTMSGRRDIKSYADKEQVQQEYRLHSPPEYPTPELSSQDSAAVSDIPAVDLTDLDGAMQTERYYAEVQCAFQSIPFSAAKGADWVSDDGTGTGFAHELSAETDQARHLPSLFRLPRRSSFLSPTKAEQTEFGRPCPVGACQEHSHLHQSAELFLEATLSPFTDINQQPSSNSRNDLGEQLNPVQIDFRYCPNCIQPAGCGLVLLRDTMPTFRTMTGLIKDCWTRNAIEMRITSAHDFSIPYDGLPNFSLAQVFVAFPGNKEIMWGREDVWQVALKEMRGREWRDCLVAVWVSDHGCATCLQLERDKRRSELEAMRKRWDEEKEKKQLRKEARQARKHGDGWIAGSGSNSESDRGDGSENESESDSERA